MENFDAIATPRVHRIEILVYTPMSTKGNHVAHIKLYIISYYPYGYVCVPRVLPFTHYYYSPLRHTVC